MKEVIKDHNCCLNDVGISCQEHIEHHRYIKKVQTDMGTVTKAVLASLVTILTGGLLGLIWLGIQSKVGVK